MKCRCLARKALKDSRGTQEILGLLELLALKVLKAILAPLAPLATQQLLLLGQSPLAMLAPAPQL